MIDKAIVRFGIGVALLLMVSELTYVNSLSLVYIVNKQGGIHEFFAVIGSLAFSIVTVIVMRTSDKRWPKVVFPIFDAALVFCGFNLEYYDKIVAGTDNEVRFYMTIVLALFTGFITFCLGIINYEKFTKSDNDESDSKILEYARKVDASESKYDSLKSKFDDRERQFIELEGKFEVKQSKYNELFESLKSVERECSGLESQLVEYKRYYLLSEKSRILKKLEKNRTSDELELLKEAELLN